MDHCYLFEVVSLAVGSGRFGYQPSKNKELGDIFPSSIDLHGKVSAMKYEINNDWGEGVQAGSAGYC